MQVQTDHSNRVKRLRVMVDKSELEKKRNLENTGISIESTKKKLHIHVEIKVETILVDHLMRLIMRFKIPIELYGSKNTCKEMSEASTGIYYARKFSFMGKVRCYVIGEGNTPRVSYVLAHIRPEWDIISVDPELKTGYEYLTIPGNLKLQSILDTELDLSDQNDYDSVVIIGIHSHNNMKHFWNRIVRPKLLITLPCCVKTDLSDPYLKVEHDGVLSAKNTIYIWKTDFVETDRPS